MPIHNVDARKIVKCINCTVACVVILSQKMGREKSKKAVPSAKVWRELELLVIFPFPLHQRKSGGENTKLTNPPLQHKPLLHSM